MLSPNLTRFWRTARHLRFSQVAWRARRMADGMAERRLPKLGIESDFRVELNDVHPPRLPPLTRPLEFDGERLLTELAAGQLTLLNERKTLGCGPIRWPTAIGSTDRLWNVTLHYHQWLFALLDWAETAPDRQRRQQARELARTYLSDWLCQCDTVGRRSQSMAWNSYAIATRLPWWARIVARLGESLDPADLRLAAALRHSAARQAAYLHEHLEWDLRANHLLRDCVGLAAAACLFDGHQASQWHRTAKRVALEQAREQVLPDGGHFERSPMYHLETLEDFAMLLHCFADDFAAREVLADTVERMTDFACWMQHPDGQTPQFNDSTRRHVGAVLAAVGDFGRPAQAPGESATVGANRRCGLRWLRDTGVIVWRSPEWSVFFDVGPVGPDYQPGHAHADTLTLECSVGDERLLIDPGVGRYDAGPERRYDRATASHNTVCLQGLDSSEVWHIFRVGRRAYPLEVSADTHAGGFTAAAAHNGYDHLPGRPRHARVVTVDRRAGLSVVDRIDGSQPQAVEGQWLLEPRWSVAPGDGRWLLRSPTQEVVAIVESEAALEFSTEPACCHFDFGDRRDTTRLRWRYHGPLPLEVRTIFFRPQGS